ncbi:BA75_04769T0 [Komagataella pastoris]|uniref:BA75_04769T0 n=1 Tax=Komagataella pastoris TaxID=4922 RepID=A0A1B2JIV5_PICPA|nr:BA75_04769T0 [Komagataella pastoris]
MSVAASKTKSNSSSTMKGFAMDQSPKLNRTVSHSSTISNSTLHANFQNNWFPNSEIVPQKQYTVTLKLSSREIEMVQNSWADILSMDVTNSGVNGGNLAPSNTKSSKSRSTTKILNVNTASFASSTFCVQFYNNLITMIPGVEKLFPSIKHQAISFAGVMNSAVVNLGDLAAMHDYLENLGRRHARILGIDPPYFKKMGEALVKTFRDRYSKDMSQFSVELEELWIRLYCFLANSILQGGIDPIVRYEPPNMIDSGRKSLLSDTDSVLFEENASTASSLAETSNVTPTASAASSFFSGRQSLASTMDMVSTSGGVPSPSRARMGSTTNMDLKKKAVTGSTGRNFSKRSQFSRMKKGGSKPSNPDEPNCVLM